MKTFVIVALAVLSLALGGYAVVQHRAKAALEAELAAARAEAEQLASIGSTKKQQAGETARLREELKEAKAELAAVSEEESKGDAGADAAKKKKKPAADFMKGLAKMMDDPAMKEMIKQQQGVMVDGMYGQLISDLDLSDEEADALRALLMEKQMTAAELGMKMMDRSLPADERKALAEQFRAENKRIKEEIRTLLGDESFESFQLFEQSQPERQQLGAYKQALTGKGVEMSYETEQQLMTAMYDARNDFKFSTDFGDNANPDADAMMKFNKDSMEQYMGEYEQLQGKIYGEAGSILNEEQLGAFKSHQDSYLQMMRMGMKMSLNFTGGGEAGSEE